MGTSENQSPQKPLLRGVLHEVAAFVAGSDLRSKADLVAENEALTTQLASIQDQKARMVELVQENDETIGDNI